MAAPVLPPLEDQEHHIRRHLASTQARSDSVVHAFDQLPILQEALDDWFYAIDSAWRGSKPADAEGRERLYHAYLAGKRFRDYLRGVLDAGKASAKTAAEIFGEHGSIDRNGT